MSEPESAAQRSDASYDGLKQCGESQQLKKQQKKGDTRIKKPTDALLSDSYSEPKLTYSLVDAVSP